MVKRRALPDLSHVLEDPRPLPALPVFEKRIHTRFDKAFPVVIGSELYGDSFAIARNVSAGGILVEMSYAPPLGTVVTVHFQHARESEGPASGEAASSRMKADHGVVEIVARAEVKHHHYLNFSGAGDGDAASTRAIGLRFLEFVDVGDRVDPQRIQ